MGDKFAPLGDDEAAQKTPAGDEWTPVVPVPDGAPKALAAIDAFAKFKGFFRTGLWQYTDADGSLLAFTARFDHPPNGDLREKEFRQFTFCRNASGRREWRCKSLRPPRPLYGLARLAANPGAPVLIVEGEKTAEAAATCFPGHVVITSSHGAKSARTADWLPLAGREVTVWPDLDTAGDGYAADVAAMVGKSGARAIRIVTVPPDFPVSWDLADKAPEWADLLALLNAAASWRNGPDTQAQKALEIARVTDAATFMRSYVPISYTFDGVLPSGYLYGLTGRRGDGKTAWAIAGTLAVVTGDETILGCIVRRGRVAYIVMENPVDFKMKLAANCYLHNLSYDDVAPLIAIIEGGEPPEAIIEGLRLDAEENGAFQLVNYDTFQAGFAMSGHGDFNDNAEVLKFLRRLRPFTELPGQPSTLVLMHPTKNAGEDDLVPYGGGAIINELDGNLTVWSAAPYRIKFWRNKVRGPEFEPRHFQIDKLSCPDIVDIDGRQILLPALRATTELDVEERAMAESENDIALLRALMADPKASQSELAKAIGLSKSAIGPKLKKLLQAKMITFELGTYAVAERVKKRLNAMAKDKA